MKTSDEILLFLVKNSVPQYHSIKISPTKDWQDTPKKKSRKEKRDDLLLSLSGTTRYFCPSKALEDFLEEEIDFEKHLRKLYEDGFLYFKGVAEPGSHYDSPKYREIFAKNTGQVKDYSTNISYVAFHYREDKFLEDYNNIIETAEELKI